MDKRCRSVFIVLIVTGSLFALQIVVRAQAADSLSKDIRRIINEYDEAWNKKNDVTVGKILADEHVYFSSTGRVTTRKQTLEFLMSPKYILRSANRSELAVYSARNTVVVSSRWKGNGMFNDEEFNDDQRCSMVFTKERKGWKLLSEHCTPTFSNKRKNSPSDCRPGLGVVTDKFSFLEKIRAATDYGRALFRGGYT